MSNYIGTLSNLVETDNSLSVVWTITEKIVKLNTDVFFSPLFSGVNKNIEFCLSLRKITDVFGSYISSQLHCNNNTDKIVGIRCKLKIIKSRNNSELQLVGLGLFDSNSPISINPALIDEFSQSSFEHQNENGTIKIKIILDFIRPDFQQGINRDQATCTDDTYDHNKSQNNYSTISPAYVLDTLLTSQKFSDFVIKVEGQEIAVHKGILASRSSVFCAVLENNFSESNLGYLEITDIDKDTMTSFIRYLYTSQVTISNVGFAQKLFVVADKYDVPDLRLVCENYICGNINASNVVDILMFADLHNAGDIKGKASDFAVDNFKAINHAQFDILGEQAPLLLVTLMKKLSLK